jgi:hypothetical protein
MSLAPQFMVAELQTESLLLALKKALKMKILSVQNSKFKDPVLVHQMSISWLLKSILIK